MEYIVEIDETYRIDGTRTFYNFLNKEEAIFLYNKQRRGFVNIIEVDESSKRILKDELGRKYIKGSPFYDFPHVPHISIIDGKEIETT